MVFSVLAMILAFVAQISRICEFCRAKAAKFTRKSIISDHLNVNSSLLQPHHAFAYKTIKQCILQVLSFSPETKLWFRRSDVSMKVEVYFVEDFIQSYQQLNAHFDVTILHFNNNDSDSSPPVLKSFVKSLDKINKVNEGNRQLMHDSLVSRLRLQENGFSRQYRYDGGHGNRKYESSSNDRNGEQGGMSIDINLTIYVCTVYIYIFLTLNSSTFVFVYICLYCL